MSAVELAAEAIHENECGCGYDGEHTYEDIDRRESNARVAFASIDRDDLSRAFVSHDYHYTDTDGVDWCRCGAACDDEHPAHLAEVAKAHLLGGERP